MQAGYFLDQKIFHNSKRTEFVLFESVMHHNFSAKPSLLPQNSSNLKRFRSSYFAEVA